MSQGVADKLVGRVIDNFEIQDVIGRGGMGIVYRAYHPALQLYAAVKVMRPEFAAQPGFYERFLQEARTIARLEHPNIVDVINFGRYEDSYYLMMDFIQGPSLRQILREYPEGISVWDCVHIAWQIADVLVYSHSFGVLHRDLKPDNILLSHSIRPNRPYRVIVTDFGLVKLGQGSLLETQQGISLGTPAYMSPEQCRGEDVDGRTDVYALGIMLYETATGRRPYPIRNLADAAKYHSLGKLVAPRSLNQAVPQELDEIIRRMMAPSLDRRIGSAAEATDVLQELMLDLEQESEGRVFPSDLVQRIERESRLSGEEEEDDEGSTTPTLAPTPKVKEEEAKKPEQPEAEPVPQTFFIQVSYEGRLEDTVYPLKENEPIILGRHASSDIVLDRPGQRFVSRRHCEVLLRGGRVLVRDLGSSNGTLLGDTPLQENVFRAWTEQQQVIMGPFRLILRTGAELEEAPSPPAREPEAAVPFSTTTRAQSNLRLACPNAVPSRLPLDADHPVLVGRAMDCDMVIEHPHVSKHHCRIQVSHQGVEVVDLRSTNGTVMNGQRLPPHVAIPWRDTPTIHLGPFTITLEK